MQHCPSFLPAYRNSSVVSSSVEYALQRQQQLSYTAAHNVLQEHRFVNKMQAPGASVIPTLTALSSSLIPLTMNRVIRSSMHELGCIAESHSVDATTVVTYSGFY